METIAGPWFEDFKIGDCFADAPSVTVTEAYAAIHQSLFGDRMRLPIDHELSSQVVPSAKPLVNPCLVANIAIGQSTFASQRVMGNLFYRGLTFKTPVFIGDTLKTTTRVVALRQNRIREGRANSGMVALEIQVQNQHGNEVMLFWRCPMIPCRDPGADTGHADSFDDIPQGIDTSLLMRSQAPWNLDAFRKIPGLHFDGITPGVQYEVEARDTVTSAPELVRLTLNMAMTHTDVSRSVYDKRLVYGGHTISMAAAQLSRAMPNMLTICAWRECDHLGPVYEQDVLRSVITIGDKYPIESGGGLVDIIVEVYAQGSAETDEENRVLNWSLVGRFA
jgi:acyl dehydratase